MAGTNAFSVIEGFSVLAVKDAPILSFVICCSASVTGVAVKFFESAAIGPVSRLESVTSSGAVDFTIASVSCVAGLSLSTIKYTEEISISTAIEAAIR